MSVKDVSYLIRQAAQAGFHKVVLTGGEPLAHPQRAELLAELIALRTQIKPARLVLRTNLAYATERGLLEKIVQCADQVVISLDGDEGSHDGRRGAGAYARTVANLRRLFPLSPDPSPLNRRATSPQGPQIVLAATLSAAQIAGVEGETVRRLAQELGAGVRFKPVLPLGRAAGEGLGLEFYSSLDEDGETRLSQLQPAATCGLGMNLYISPDGECYPCYALTGSEHHLGNALENGLEAVLASEGFQRLKRVTVDSNEKCRGCGLRYLCGGFCRAWGSPEDPDAPPADCRALQERARGLLLSALEALEVSEEKWGRAGLSIDKIKTKKGESFAPLWTT
jgi:radical SAM protein with 4Fe4S-binding SPASM domain